MNLQNNSIINLYSIAILLVIGVHSYKNDEKESYRYKLYIMMLHVTILMLIVDIFSRFDGMSNSIYPILNQMGNLLIFILNPIMPSIWLLYVHYQIFLEETKTKKLIYPLLFINIFNIVMVVLTQFFGWYYYIDSQNIYHRGPLFGLSCLYYYSTTYFNICYYCKKSKYNSEKILFFSYFLCDSPIYRNISTDNYLWNINNVK